MQLEQISERYRLKPLFVTFGLFISIAILGSAFTPTKFMTLLSIMAGVFAYLIIPGYFLLLNLELDDIERIILSTAVGISLIPILLFLLNLLMIKITLGLVFGTIVAITLTGILLKERSARSTKSK
jgi:uncharacterized membrane protein